MNAATIPGAITRGGPTNETIIPPKIKRNKLSGYGKALKHLVLHTF